MADFDAPFDPALALLPPDTGDEGEVCDGYRLGDEGRPPDWVIPGLIVAGGQIIVAGEPKKARKSIAMLSLGIAVSRGEPWLGRPTVRRQVFWVVGEDGKERAAWRLRLLGLTSALNPNDLDRSAFQVRFGVEGYAQAMVAARHRPVLVIVDPMVEITSARGLDENDNAQMASFLRAHRLATQVSRATIIWIHHFRKAGDMMRGASSMQGAVDGWFDSTPAKERNVVKMAYTLRDAESGSFAVKIEGTTVNGATRLTVEPVATNDTDTATQLATIEQLRHLFAQHTGAGFSMNTAAESLGTQARRDTFREAWETLIECQEINKVARLYVATEKLKAHVAKQRGLF